MPGSSATVDEVVGATRPEDVLHLLEIIRGATLRDVEHVEASYRLHGTRFGDTLAFVAALGWLKVSDGRVEVVSSVVDEIFSVPGTTRTHLLALALFQSPGPFDGTFSAYLCQFVTSEDRVWFTPSQDELTTHASARDFLMSLGVVTFDVPNLRYELTPAFHHLAIWAKAVASPRSRDGLTRKGDDQAALGAAAEVAVLQWERARLGPTFANRVVHVSQSRPLAPFDIQSVTLGSSTIEPRFIEVKAVPSDTYRFHWSASEIAAARLVRGRYFLYLLPVGQSMVFDFDRLLIVADPVENVYLNTDAWIKSESDIVCQRRSAT